MAAPDPKHSPERVTQTSSGYCPVCGAEVLWMPTAHLWPSRKSARAALPSQSAVCSRCQRVLIFTVVDDPTEDAGSATR